MSQALQPRAINGNLIKQLRLQAEKAWQEEMRKCTQEKIWSRLNASIYDIHMIGISWKLKWIEQALDRLQSENAP